MQKATYTRTAIVLHWLIGFGVLAQITLGLWMIGIPKSPPGVRAAWFNLHKSIGITLAVLILVRLAWRFFHPAPPLPNWERVAAKANHALLYVCMIVMPVSGYLGSSFTKYPVLYFGMRLPHWGWDAPALKELCSQVHFTTVVIFITLIAIHIAAAVKHWLIDRDGVAQRMWFIAKTAVEPPIDADRRR